MTGAMEGSIRSWRCERLFMNFQLSGSNKLKQEYKYIYIRYYMLVYEIIACIEMLRLLLDMYRGTFFR